MSTYSDGRDAHETSRLNPSVPLGVVGLVNLSLSIMVNQTRRDCTVRLPTYRFQQAKPALLYSVAIRESSLGQHRQRLSSQPRGVALGPDSGSLPKAPRSTIMAKRVANAPRSSVSGISGDCWWSTSGIAKFLTGQVGRFKDVQQTPEIKVLTSWSWTILVISPPARLLASLGRSWPVETHRHTLVAF